MLEKTFEQLEELGYDVTDVRYNCSHLYYGAWDKVIKNKTPQQALKYVENLLSKCSADGNYSEVRGLQRYPLLIDSIKDFIRKNKKTSSDVFFQLYLPSASYIAMQLYSAYAECYCASHS